MSKTFLISSLLAAGFGKASPEQAAFTQMTRDTTDGPAGNLFQIYRQNHLVTLAQHRSHSSHSSHSSHASHRSSYGGYDAPASRPAPVYTQPAPSYTQPSPSTSDTTSVRSQPLFGDNSGTSSSGSASSLPSLSGRTKKFERIVTLVQIGLMAQGVYNGPLNGSVGPLTRSALRKFQQDHGLTVTGTITPETLDALKVSSSE